MNDKPVTRGFLIGLSIWTAILTVSLAVGAVAVRDGMRQREHEQQAQRDKAVEILKHQNDSYIESHTRP